MPDDAGAPATSLDIGVVFVVGLAGLGALLVGIATVTQADVLLTASTIAVVGASSAVLCGLWHRPTAVTLQVPALLGVVFVAFAAGPYAYPVLGYVAVMLLVAVLSRHFEAVRLDHDRRAVD
ncbi:hypothetical protein [Nocardioides sp.]|uniref:hypothetical protein n=1 Tax=Nocardioides sp. TaxID=35761 RepID=UPI002715DCF6|nr:hypothetical protein [Nocardioides sp.]MDO9455029.1 hypothetical protein [Nocardioides sp.]